MKSNGESNSMMLRDEEANHINPSSFGISSLTYQTRSTTQSESSSLSDEGCHKDITSVCPRRQTVLEELSSSTNQLYSKDSLYYGDQANSTFDHQQSQNNEVYVTDDDDQLGQDMLCETLEVKNEQLG
jgi:hypothetical protein